MFNGALPIFYDAINGTKQEIKASPGSIVALRLVNTTGATAYLQVFDLPAADVTVGTTTASFCVRLGANESLMVAPPMPIDLQSGTGITMAGTTTATGSTGAAISVLALVL